MPSVWPWGKLKLTPSTAFTWSTVRCRKPFLIGNQTLRSSTSSNGAPTGLCAGSPLGSALISIWV
ncbi:hypothetical protein D3C75_1345160 [compost metagenome]